MRFFAAKNFFSGGKKLAGATIFPAAWFLTFLDIGDIMK
jgi:hypothetical protein